LFITICIEKRYTRPLNMTKLMHNCMTTKKDKIIVEIDDITFDAI